MSTDTTGCCGVKKQKLSNTQVASNAIACALSCLPHVASQAIWSNGHTQHAPGCPQATMNGRYDYDDMEESEASSSASTEMSPVKPKVVSPEMVVFCFDVLFHYLKGLDVNHEPVFPNQQFPLFVTWKLGKERKLRGCIGTFNNTCLHQGLREYSITSAVKDSRFDPIHVDEFTRLHCSVSLLTDFEVAQHYLDWQIGVHGIRIEFTSDKGSKKAATYLPEVAVEQGKGWNHIQTIDSLLRKGGYKGSISPDVRATVCVIRFQSDKLSISHNEYVAHKNRHNNPSSSNDMGANGGMPKNGYRNGYHKPKGPRSGIFSSFSSSSTGSASSASSTNNHRYPTRSSWLGGRSSNDHSNNHTTF